LLEVDIHKRFGAQKDSFDLKINFEVSPGQIIAVYGDSGEGKTTLLRAISGLEKPDTGRVSFDNQLWFDSSTKYSMSPQQRKLGFVFQENTLFPHLTVRQNVAFAVNDKKDLGRVDEMIQRVEIKDLEDRYPSELSGGQRQKVALARSLVQRPKLLLLDEPLSALDHTARTQLQDLILEIHKELQLTILLVSHDVPEIIKMADSVIRIHKGSIESINTPQELFGGNGPSDEFHMTGTILSFEQKEGSTFATVYLHSNVLQVRIPEDEKESFKVGDEISLSAANFDPKVRKI
jgi:molybdate transport system ATP-binding protein